MGGGLENRCVGRVYGADGAVRVAVPNVKLRTIRRRGSAFIFNIEQSECILPTHFRKTHISKMQPTSRACDMQGL